MLFSVALYSGPDSVLVPRNIICSKKWAKPDLPGSTSLRDPTETGICSETMSGKPVSTTMTRSPLGRSRMWVGKG